MCFKTPGLEKNRLIIRRLQFWPVIFAMAVGCAADTTGLGQLSRVTGEVEFNGEPTPGAIVEFVRKEDASDGKPHSLPVDAPRTFGVVGDDGKFEIMTFVPEGSKRGAARGDYLISITWTKPIDPDDKDSSPGPDRLPAKYKEAMSSGLEYEVVAGENSVPPFSLVP